MVPRLICIVTARFYYDGCHGYDQIMSVVYSDSHPHTEGVVQIEIPSVGNAGVFTIMRLIPVNLKLWDLFF